MDNNNSFYKLGVFLNERRGFKVVDTKTETLKSSNGRYVNFHEISYYKTKKKDRLWHSCASSCVSKQHARDLCKMFIVTKHDWADDLYDFQCNAHDKEGDDVKDEPTAEEEVCDATTTST
jgi:hypothetical protein